MALLRPRGVHISRFMWRPTERMLVADLSDLGREPFGRVYDDACDLGLTVIGRREEVVYAISGEKRDGEGELQWFDLTAVGSRNDITVRLFND